MLDVDRLMTGLAETRPIFHSEADFQHALAWEIHQAMPDCQIRLEFNASQDSAERRYLDLWLPTLKVAIELKYCTRNLAAAFADERFALKNQSANDVRRYDFLKDIQRIEQSVEDGPAETGIAVLLTNDPLYWKPAGKSDVADAAFHIHDGREITGRLAWSEKAGKGTRDGRAQSITINAAYTMRWRDYSQLPEPGKSRFRYLAVSVGG